MQKACPSLMTNPEFKDMLHCSPSLESNESGLCVEIPAADPKRSPLAKGILGVCVAAGIALIIFGPLSECFITPALRASAASKKLQ